MTKLVTANRLMVRAPASAQSAAVAALCTVLEVTLTGQARGLTLKVTAAASLVAFGHPGGSFDSRARPARAYVVSYRKEGLT